MKLFTTFILALTFFCTSFSARADSIVLPSNVTVTPTRWNTGSYNATITTPTGTGAPGTTDITMVCIDVLRPGPPIGQSYAAVISTFNDFAQTRQPTLGNYYKAAAWLYTKITDPAYADSVASIQQSMWSFLTPSYGINPANPWTVAALAAAPTFNTTNFIIITPTSAGTQEMIAKVSRNLAEVPEPATLFLLGTGLATLASRIKRRKPEDPQ